MESLKRFYLRRIKTSEESYSIIPFKSYNIVIGRSPEATFNIHDCLISRKHAVFSRSTNKDKWIVKNLSLNGVFVNEQLVPKEEEKEVGVGDIIQFGMPANFIYRLGMKIIGSSQIASTSQAKKRLKLDNTTYSQDELTQEHDTLSKRLEECDALKARLQEEQKSMHNSIREQQELLEKKYKEDREVLEKKYSEGAMAQKFMLEEKESLALELENQVRALRSQLKMQQSTLEERLKKEEEERCKISQEKEEVLKRLEEEKKRLETKLQEEQKDLQDQLKVTESFREKLQKQVEEKETLIKAKEEEQLRANEEKKQLKDQLAQEKQALQEELENVRHALEEKNKKFSDLHSELQSKEEELQDKMMSLETGVQERLLAEIEKSSALAKKQLDDLIKDKTELEEKLKQAQEHDKEELSNLQVVLDTVEAQKLSLEQELACSAIASDNARKEVVDSVSDVLENEMQCPICNELFITAMTLGCSHTFCKYCIGQWKKNKMECPNCRMRITSETRSLVVDNFIEKVVPTLSEELQNKRREIVAERASEIAAMEAQVAAAAQTAARNRGGGRRARGRNRQRQQNIPTQVRDRIQVNHMRLTQSGFVDLTHGTRASVEIQNQATHSINNIERPAVTTNVSSAIVPTSNTVTIAVVTASNTATISSTTSRPTIIARTLQTPVVPIQPSSTEVTPNTVVHVPIVTLPVASALSTLPQRITVIVPRSLDSSTATQQQLASNTNQNTPLTSNAVSLPGSSTNPIVIGSALGHSAVGGMRATARPPIQGRRGHWANGCPSRW